MPYSNERGQHRFRPRGEGHGVRVGRLFDFRNQQERPRRSFQSSQARGPCETDLEEELFTLGESILREPIPKRLLDVVRGLKLRACS
jgi:hypothetical protein